MSPAVKIAIAAQALLAVLGLIVLWRYVLRKTAREGAVATLPAWHGEPAEFVLLLALFLGCTFFAGVTAATFLKGRHLPADPTTVVSAAAAQIGMLTAVGIFAVRSPGYRSRAPRSTGYLLVAGAATFAVAMPVLNVTSAAWELLLHSFGIPAERQDLIRMFAESNSWPFLVALSFLAVVIAPLTEELVFRGGLYRFFRPRAPRWIGLLIPAVIFASLHVNWPSLEGFASFAPLVVLAILLSLAYERTGHIGVPIIAHALFNLNTILQILCGLAK